MALWLRFMRASQDVLDAVEGDLKAAGYPPLGWYDALLELSRAGPCGLRQYELGERTLLAQYALSRLVDRLRKAGYAACARCPEDGRGQMIRITAEGRALIAEMWPAYRDAVAARFYGRLDEDGRRALDRAMAAFEEGRAP